MDKKRLIIIMSLIIIAIIGCIIGWRINIHERDLKIAELKVEITKQILSYDQLIKYKAETHFNTDEITLVFKADDDYTLDKYGMAVVGLRIDKQTYKVKSMYGNELIGDDVQKMLKEKNKFME